MPLEDEHRQILAGVIETLIPDDPAPSPRQTAIIQSIEARLETDLKPLEPALIQWLTALTGEAGTVFSSHFLGLHPSTRDELFDRIESDNLRTDWNLAPFDATPAQLFARLVDFVADTLDDPTGGAPT